MDSAEDVQMSPDNIGRGGLEAGQGSDVLSAGDSSHHHLATVIGRLMEETVQHGPQAAAFRNALLPHIKKLYGPHDIWQRSPEDESCVDPVAGASLTEVGQSIITRHSDRATLENHLDHSLQRRSLSLPPIAVLPHDPPEDQIIWLKMDNSQPVSPRAPLTEIPQSFLRDYRKSINYHLLEAGNEEGDKLPPTYTFGIFKLFKERAPGITYPLQVKLPTTGPDHKGAARQLFQQALRVVFHNFADSGSYVTTKWKSLFQTTAAASCFAANWPPHTPFAGPWGTTKDDYRSLNLGPSWLWCQFIQAVLHPNSRNRLMVLGNHIYPENGKPPGKIVFAAPDSRSEFTHYRNNLGEEDITRFVAAANPCPCNLCDPEYSRRLEELLHHLLELELLSLHHSVEAPSTAQTDRLSDIGKASEKPKRVILRLPPSSEPFGKALSNASRVIDIIAPTLSAQGKAHLPTVKRETTSVRGRQATPASSQGGALTSRVLRSSPKSSTTRVSLARNVKTTSQSLPPRPTIVIRPSIAKGPATPESEDDQSNSASSIATASPEFQKSFASGGKRVRSSSEEASMIEHDLVSIALEMPQSLQEMTVFDFFGEYHQSAMVVFAQCEVKFRRQKNISFGKLKNWLVERFSNQPHLFCSWGLDKWQAVWSGNINNITTPMVLPPSFVHPESSFDLAYGIAVAECLARIPEFPKLLAIQYDRVSPFREEYDTGNLRLQVAVCQLFMGKVSHTMPWSWRVYNQSGWGLLPPAIGEILLGEIFLMLLDRVDKFFGSPRDDMSQDWFHVRQLPNRSVTAIPGFVVKHGLNPIFQQHVTRAMQSVLSELVTIAELPLSLALFQIGGCLSHMFRVALSAAIYNPDGSFHAGTLEDFMEEVAVVIVPDFMLEDRPTSVLSISSTHGDVPATYGMTVGLAVASWVFALEVIRPGCNLDPLSLFKKYKQSCFSEFLLTVALNLLTLEAVYHPNHRVDFAVFVHSITELYIFYSAGLEWHTTNEQFHVYLLELVHMFALTHASQPTSRSSVVVPWEWTRVRVQETVPWFMKCAVSKGIALQALFELPSA